MPRARREGVARKTPKAPKAPPPPPPPPKKTDPTTHPKWASATPEQRDACMRIYNGESMMILGGAGVGKSYLLSMAAETTSALVTATTGTAAVLVGGQTVYSALCDTPEFAEKEYFHWLKTRSRAAFRALRGIETIIVEEASMLSVPQVQRMDKQLRDLGNRVRPGRNELPFGGYQMVFFLDLTQLPPVKDNRQLLCDAPAIKKLAPGVVILDKMFRQTTPLLVHLVECARYCTATPLAVLIAVTMERIAKDVREFAGGMVATSLRRDAEQINDERIGAYDHPVEIPVKWDNNITGAGRYTVQGKQIVVTEVLKDKSSLPPARNRVAVGAPVVITRNISQKRVTNGMMGKLLHINATGTEAQVVVGDGHRRRVVTLGVTDAYTMCCKVARVAEPMKVSGRALPIRAAYASTIHCLQGNTVVSSLFLKLHADWMECGLLYTAVSRVVSLRNLLPEGLVESFAKCKMHPSAERFIDEHGKSCAERRAELARESAALLPRFADMFYEETGIPIESLRFVLYNFDQTRHFLIHGAFAYWVDAGLRHLFTAPSAPM